MATDELPDKPNSKAGVGRHRFRAKWTPARRAKFLARLSETGNVRLASALAGISRRHVYVRRRSDGGFARAWDDALEKFDERREEAARIRALDSYRQPIVEAGELAREPVSHETVVPVRLRKRTLEAHRPKKYRHGVSAKTPDPHENVDLVDSTFELVVGRIIRVLHGKDPLGDSDGRDGSAAGEAPP